MVTNWIYVSNVGWPHITVNEWASHGTETRPCYKRYVLVHCLAGRQTHLQQCCKSLAASATLLDNTGTVS